MSKSFNVVTEHGMLFKTDMVKAILAGRKTQTRRILATQPSGGVRQSPFTDSGLEDVHGYPIKVPYRVGDTIWVRETFSVIDNKYFSEKVDDLGQNLMYKTGLASIYQTKWTPSLHMARHQSRIDLEITKVQVQQLQVITTEDAIAEGIVAYKCLGGTYYRADGDVDTVYETPVRTYQALWDSIYDKRAGSAWNDNPWVVALTFKVKEKGASNEKVTSV